MLELFIATLFQISVLVSGSAPTAGTDSTTVSAQSTSNPTATTNKSGKGSGHGSDNGGNIGGTGWDDRN